MQSTILMIIILLLFPAASFSEKEKKMSGFESSIQIWKVLEERGQSFEKPLKRSFEKYSKNPNISKPYQEFCREQSTSRELPQCDENGISFLVNESTRLYFSKKQEIVSAKVSREGTITFYIIGKNGIADRFETTDGENRIIFDIDRELRKKTVFIEVTGRGGLDVFSSKEALDWLTSTYFLDYEPKKMRLDTFCRRLLLDWNFREKLTTRWNEFLSRITIPKKNSKYAEEITGGPPIPPIPKALPGGGGDPVSFMNDGLTDVQYLKNKIKEVWKKENYWVSGIKGDTVTLDLIYTTKGSLISARIQNPGLNDDFAIYLVRLIHSKIFNLERELHDQNEFKLKLTLGEVQNFKNHQK